MKLVRLLLIGLAVLVVFLAAGIGIAFTSSFQTWAARKVLASRPDLRGTIGSVSAGLKRVEVKNLHLERNGAVLTLPAVTAELPVLAAIVSRKVSITRLVAKGWVLDLTRATRSGEKPLGKTAANRARDFSFLSPALAAGPAGPASDAEIFRGVFAQRQLPVDLTLDGLELEGEAILPPLQSQPAVRIKLIVTGGGLAAGRDGSFAYNLSADTGAGVAPISAHALRGTLAATMDTPRSFMRISTKAEASVSGTQFPRGVTLNLNLVAARDATGESYVMTLAGEDKQLAAVQAVFPLTASAPTATSKLSGTWKLNLRDADLVPFAVGMALPAFEAAGDGGFELDAAFAEIHARGKLNANVESLANLKPELAAVGALRLDAAFDLSQRGDVLRIERLTADFSGAKRVASVRALQAFEFNPRTGELTANPAQDLLGVTLQGVPLAWARPFLPGFAFGGGDLQGEFVASAGGGGLALRPKGPLAISQLSVEQTGRPLIEAVDLSADVSADYTPQGWQVVIAPLTGKSGTGTLLTLEAKAGQLAGKDRPIKATGKLALSLPSILAQPVAAGSLQLTAGDATLEFSASLSKRQEIQAKLAISNLAADPKLVPEILPAITTDLRADREADGKISLNLPLFIERDGRKSDLNITGSLVPGKTGYTLDAHLTSGLLVLDDVKILTAPFASPGEAPPGEEKNPPRDAVPLWAGLNGKLSLALKKIVCSDNFQMADVGGTLRFDAGAMKLEGFKAGLGEGEMKLNGDVLFNPKVTEPYSLKAELAVSNFDSVPLFRALDPAKPPTVEGKFDVTSQLNGTGPNLAELAARTRGDVLLTSKGGVFRALAADVTEKVQKTQAAVTAIGGLIGAVTGKEKIVDYANRAQIIADIAKALAEIPFDQLSVAVKRDASLNVNLQDFTLISPEIRLGGTGQIAYQEAAPVLAQVLDLHLQIAARGKVADLMRRASLLNGTQDNLGYASFAVPVHIGGSLDSPDTAELRAALLKAAGGSLLDSLMGR